MKGSWGNNDFNLGGIELKSIEDLSWEALGE